MPRVGFEATILVLERPKTIRASDRSVTGTGITVITDIIFIIEVTNSLGCSS